MQKILFLTGILSSSGMLFSQELHFDKCGTVTYQNYRETIQPGYINAMNETFEIAKKSAQGIQEKSQETYIIPVVFHIVYNDSIQNLADSIIYSQIDVLNQDYNRLNSDSVNLRSEFFPHVGRANIEFRLAEFDPDGNPTTGITRTKTNKTSFLEDPFALLSGDMSSLEKVKSSNDGGIDAWDQKRYMNIWVCNMTATIAGNELPPMLLGYATPPSNLPNWPPGSTGGLNDGLVIQYHCIGNNNPNTFMPLGGNDEYISQGRTVVHESGHYLGLRHIWGDGDCTEEDGINDTPNADKESASDCNKEKNSCVDSIDGIDLPDMVENYMDYSAETCQNTFTKGQVELMRGVLENQRKDLVQNNPALTIDKEDIPSFELFPNPSSNVVTIETSGWVKGEIFILDNNGRIVKTATLQNSTATIHIEDLQQGIYHVTLNRGGFVSKLVKL